jgi:hypothetical protein
MRREYNRVANEDKAGFLGGGLKIQAVQRRKR